MSDTCMYEGLFLFPQAASVNLQAATDHVHELLKRANAEVVSFRKWDERRLAYEIKGNKRGVYFLAFFRADPASLVVLERDCNLSEQLLKSLVTRADHVPAQQIEAADGRAQLADEIKLRSSEAESEGARTTGTTTVTAAAPAPSPAASPAPAAPAPSPAPAASPAASPAPAAPAPSPAPAAPAEPAEPVEPVEPA